MRDSKVLRLLLLASGVVALAVSGGLLLDPVRFEAGAGVVLSADPSVLSEVRAPAGALLAAGVLVTIGAFVRSYTAAAAGVAITLLLSYGLARVFGMVLDGVPSDALVAATVVELGLGAATLCAWWVARAGESGVGAPVSAALGRPAKT
ncbi:MAG: DUF4345 domain-containing protein [Myxococcota bacterium]